MKATNANEFYELISPSNKMWKEGRWIFRGVSNENYSLTPSIYRNNQRSPKLRDIVDETLSQQIENLVLCQMNNLKDDRLKKNMCQIGEHYCYEALLLDKFIDVCNRNRLWVDDTKILKNQHDEDLKFWLRTSFEHNLKMFFQKESNQSRVDKNMIGSIHQSYFMDFYSSVNSALAQHHGIPTRLLDWTFNPYVAAFFASYKCDKQDSNVENLCVWAFNMESYALSGGFQGIKFHEKLIKHGLEFLHLQQGLFTEMEYINTYFCRQGKWPTLDEYCQWLPEFLYRSSSDGASISKKYFKKIILPNNEAYSLQKLLDKIGVSYSKLMPTYDNVRCELITNFSRSSGRT